MRKTRYCRTSDLPSLLPLWPHELEIDTAAKHEKLLAMLQKALRAERQRGIGGHWCYDLMRHSNLLMAYRAECELYNRAWPGQRPYGLNNPNGSDNIGCDR